VCRDLITNEHDAYTWDGRIFCSYDCAKETVDNEIDEEYRGLPAIARTPLFKSEKEYEDFIAANIKPCDTTNLTAELYCGDELEVE